MFRFAATGDTLFTMSISAHKEESFLRMIDMIRQANVAFTNLEVLLHDFEGFPSGEGGGVPFGYHCVAEPYLAEEIKWMGFDMVSCANNHTMDFCFDGMLATIRAVKEAGLAHSGTGRDLAEARAPAYLETDKARVALISASTPISVFAYWGRAGETRRDCQGRPGLSTLRFDMEYVVGKGDFERLRGLRSELGLPSPSSESATEFSFLGNRFVLGQKTETRASVNKKDLVEITGSIVEATKQSDLVIVSLHYHQNLGADRFMPPQFIQEFARACVDAGAHAFVGHGPHIIRGVEIYKGKPILYSLGNFVFQVETMKKIPADFYEYYEVAEANAAPIDAIEARIRRDRVPDARARYSYQSIIAFLDYDGTELRKLELVPITLGFGEPRSQRGRPRLAEPEEAKSIIDHLKKLSEPWGTSITFQDGIGLVALDGS